SLFAPCDPRAPRPEYLSPNLGTLAVADARRLLDQPRELISRPRARGAADLTAAGEDCQRRNRSDAEPLPEVLQFVGVHLGDDRPTGLPRRDLLQLRRDHAARPAPRRP